ncbi:hypothetical protein K474DRAFT_1754359 [Panus rudis PR-1116 ss-1]|nr:hypothetical protein K474DRAFT_1754359 [Panus rudis PR-1116 ss-1]
MIFEECPPSTLIRFRATCYRAYLIVNNYIQRKHRIDRLLGRFFDDPLGFRNMQARTATLISGSIALQFFNKKYYEDSDMDLYVPMRYREEVGDYLTSVGYCYTPRWNQQKHSTFHDAVWDRSVVNATGNYIMRGVAGVFDFIKKGADGKELKVQLIVAAHCPLEIVLYFHSTCVMNVISHEAAYCLYPEATLEYRWSLLCATNGPRQDHALDKYELRGWFIVCEIYSSKAKKLFQAPTDSLGNKPPRTRWIGDGFCWTIPLDTTGIPRKFLEPSPRSSGLTRDPVTANSWSIIIDNDSQHASMKFTRVLTDWLYLGYISDSAQLNADELYEKTFRETFPFFDKRQLTKAKVSMSSNLQRLRL